jgi:nickel-dependent lactate racemase
MDIQLGYGSGTQTVQIPNKNLVGVIEPTAPAITERGAALVKRALASPIGTPKLEQIVRPGEKIVLITSDITRPLPSHTVLPPVIETLYAAGVRPEDITVVFALGAHRPHTEDEMRRLVGDSIYSSVRCVDSNPADCIHMGVTRAGTPVDITRVVAEADRRIGIGNIEYHYFAGYSGGAKALMPGVSTRAAIQANHSKMVMPEAVAGRIKDNPVRLDLEEAVTYCPLDFIVNVVLDAHKEIVFAVAGHYIEAHRAGCRFLDSLYRVDISRRADIVVASQGGYPKDINLYQTQKALDNAAHAVRDGGIIILVGACGEGLGEPVFERWIREADSPQALIERIERDFQLGGHKAAAIALVTRRAKVFLVSDMPPELVRRAHLRPFSTVQQAFDEAIATMGDTASVLVMPYAGSTLPVCLG